MARDESTFLHKCSNCGWTGTTGQHVFTELGHKRCPRCREKGIDLNTELLRSPLTWSSERPNVAGWYWVRCDDGPARICELRDSDFEWLDEHEFAGPIPEPRS